MKPSNEVSCRLMATMAHGDGRMVVDYGQPNREEVIKVIWDTVYVPEGIVRTSTNKIKHATAISQGGKHEKVGASKTVYQPFIALFGGEQSRSPPYMPVPICF